MTPQFQLLADGDDITRLLSDRLLSLTVTDKPGLNSDTCEIVLDDRDSKVRFPRKGAVLALSLGYQGEQLTRLGTYRVDTISVKGLPAQVVIKGEASHMRDGAAKAQRDACWEATTLARIVGDIAGRHGWTPVCNVDASIERADQRGETDLHFITRLARDHNATATVKGGKLLVLPRAGGRQASGSKLAAIALQASDLSDYDIEFPDRPALGGVKARWHDRNTGQPVVIDIPQPDPPPGVTAVHTDRRIYPDAAAAQAAAKSRLAAFSRATAKGRLTLRKGDARFGAEQHVTLSGIKPEVDGVYLVEEVEHRYSRDAWVTTVQINGGAGGKAGVGHGKLKPGSVKLVIPDPQQ